MNYIGNDILFKQTIETTFARTKAIMHVLTENEIYLMHFLDTKIACSLAWTIKESIYKIACKEGHNLPFVPKYIFIKDINFTGEGAYRGTAIFKNQIFSFQSEITNKYIFSYAFKQHENLDQITHYWFPNNPEIHSSMKNTELVNFLISKKWELCYSVNGIPQIKNQLNQMDISITHDHDFLVLSKLKHE